MRIRTQQLTKEQEKLIYDDYLEGILSVSEICKKHEICNNTLSRVRRDYGIPKRTFYIMNKDLMIPINENYFEIIDTEKKAYFAGFIAGDGSLVVNGKYIFLRIEIKSDDVEILKKFIIDSESMHEIKNSIRIRDEKTYSCCYLSISRRKIHEDLIKNGITPEKSITLKLPNLDDNLMRCFIRGYFDANGSWKINHANKNLNTPNSYQLVFSICGPVLEFIRQVKNYLENILNIHINTIEDCPGSWRISYSGNIQGFELFKYLYKDSIIHLERKFLKAKTHLESIKLL